MDSASEGLTLEIIVMSMSLIFFFALAFIIFFVVYQKRLLQQERTQQEKELMYQKELLQASIDGQEKERLRIAKELHDDVGTMLSTTRMYTEQLSTQTKEENRNKLVLKMNELLGVTLRSVREISHDLRPVILEKLGLHEAIKSLSETLNEAGEVRVNYTVNGSINCTKEQSINLYRILQELIANTIKHAQATQIDIQIDAEDEQIYLFYRDDGIGFDHAEMSSKKGIGMKNIESRVSLLSGEIHYPIDNSGFQIEIRVQIEV